MFKLICKILLDILFPPKCLICGKQQREVFCLECRSQNRPARECLSGVYFISEYKGNMKKAVRLYKFGKKKVLARALGEICLEYVNYSVFLPLDFILPIPLHPLRLQSRGFNQCLEIARFISEKTGIPVLDGVLVRIRNTKPQFGLKRNERFVNIKHAFQVRDPQKIQGKTLLLLDDICTTGATVFECRKVLMSAGAETIYVLTLCRALA